MLCGLLWPARFNQLIMFIKSYPLWLTFIGKAIMIKLTIGERIQIFFFM